MASTPERDVPPKLGEKHLFPKLQVPFYLNHAAVSPLSLPVERSLHAVLQSFAEGGLRAHQAWASLPGRLREKLAELINAAPDEIALTSNTGRGLSDLGLCFPWKRGDAIVAFEGEFPANVTPWQQVARLFGLSISLLPLDGEDTVLTRLRQRLLGGGVRLVTVSAVQFRSGQRMPLSEMARMCHEHDAFLCVDGIQACGVVPLDVAREGIDYLASGGHKSLMGPEGTAFVYCKKELAERLEPRIAGWASHIDPFDFLVGTAPLRYDKPFRQEISFIEGGTSNFIGYAGLEAAVSLLLELGVGNIFPHVTAYNDALEAGLIERRFASLRPAKPERRSSILSVLSPPGVDVLKLHRALNQAGVCCGLPDRAIRFSPHFENSLDEVGSVLAIMDEALRACS